MHDLFGQEIQHLYSIEKQLIDMLPSLAKKVENEELKQSLQSHLSETKNQAKRLEQIAKDEHIALDATEDMAMESILQEGNTVIDEVTDPGLRDMAIIGGSEKVEHYEMAAYESAMTLAKKLDKDDVADLLKETYDEEKKSADLLKGMAEGGLSGTVQKVAAAM